MAEREGGGAVSERAWLKELCHYHAEELVEPFLLDINGKVYECASDGHGIIALLGAGETTRRADLGAERFFEPLPLELGKVSLGMLKNWGEEVECYCDTCDPAGANEYRHSVREPFKLGRFFGRVFDRWLFWRWLANLDGHEVTVRASEDKAGHIQLFGDGWMVALMPCRDDSRLVFPAFPESVAEAAE